MKRMYPRHTHLQAVLWLAFAPVLGVCQGGQLMPAMPEGYASPDAYVQISNGRPGEQVVDVAFQELDYPREKINGQLREYQSEGGKPVMNAQVVVSGAAGTMITHVRFATTGLLDRSTGAVDIQPVVRAFAGMNNLDIWFQIPKLPYKGYGTFMSKSVDFTTRLDFGVQFFVHIKKHDPGSIVIPSLYRLPPAEGAPERPSRPVTLYVLLALGLSLGAGALVYYVLTRASSSEARQS